MTIVGEQQIRLDASHLKIVKNEQERVENSALSKVTRDRRHPKLLW